MTPLVAVIGGGPAGLMAAEAACAGGARVVVYDAMASCGRKFLLAGKGGLNLTHGESLERVLERYGARRSELAPALRAMDGRAIVAFADALGIETFVGSSGRVFPRDLKAAPLLRRWLRRLRAAGVEFRLRHRWTGFGCDNTPTFDTPAGPRAYAADAVILALGGGSWPELGSDGRWTNTLADLKIALQPLRPSNCGFDCAWSAHLRAHCAGAAVKNIRLSHVTDDGVMHDAAGEFIVTAQGIEGGAVYALSAVLRETLAAEGHAWLAIDLAPARSRDELAAALARPRGRRTLAHQLERCAGIKGVKAALLRECLPAAALADPARLAQGIKALPLRLVATRPLSESISSAGGVEFAALDVRYMLRERPGVFCAGEMLDWEAPTGGYLLTACFATGRAAALGALAWLGGTAY